MSTRGVPEAPARTMLGQRALESPTVLVTNQHSLSDAEDFTEGYRTLKLGPVVGEPTAGWIIYTWDARLVDGIDVAPAAHARQGRRRHRHGAPSAAGGRSSSRDPVGETLGDGSRSSTRRFGCSSSGSGGRSELRRLRRPRRAEIGGPGPECPPQLARNLASAGGTSPPPMGLARRFRRAAAAGVVCGTPTQVIRGSPTRLEVVARPPAPSPQITELVGSVRA